MPATLGLEPTSGVGTGVGVAVIDSGINNSSEFYGRIKAFYDFTQGGIATTPSDAFGHGTHVASLIAGSGYRSAGTIRGVAPGANLIGLKVLDANGQGNTSDVISAIEFAIQNKNALGIDIINLSLGHPPLEANATDPLVQAVEQAAQAGIIVVTAAGNFGTNPNTGQMGYAGITSPRRRRLPSVRPTQGRLSHGLTTASRPTAPAGPRGTTAWPSRMSSLRVTVWTGAP
jgi:serine protease AprX